MRGGEGGGVCGVGWIFPVLTSVDVKWHLKAFGTI